MARPQLSALLEPRGHQANPDALRAVPVSEPGAAEQAATQPPADPSPPVEATPAPAATAPKGATSKRPRRTPTARTAQPARPAPIETLPPYLRFERKESRLRADQLTELNMRARQLNKAKNPDADRITDNTLIRVAVDLLLSRADQLAGGDEDGLRRSLGLRSEG
jgi:hypothetical protein